MNSNGLGRHKQVVAVKRTNRIAVLRVTAAIAHHSANEAVGARERQGGQQVQRRTMPDRLEELVRTREREARIAIPAPAPVDENVLLVVAKITRIGEQQPERLGDLVLAVPFCGA